MKITRKESEFQPVHIILESQFEVDVLYELVGSVTGLSKARDFCNAMYKELETVSSISGKDCGTYFDMDTSVDVKED